LGKLSEIAKRAWATRRRKQSAARKALATMKKGRRIRIHSPKIKVNGSARTTYAPPKKWWDEMTKKPHGKNGKPLSPAAAGHLWFKVYDNQKRLEIIKKYG